MRYNDPETGETASGGALEGRQCVHCGDFVLALSGREWCDSCELGH